MVVYNFCTLKLSYFFTIKCNLQYVAFFMNYLPFFSKYISLFS